MPELTVKQRRLLTEQLAAAAAAAAAIAELRKPVAAQLKPYDDAIAAIDEARTLMLAAAGVDHEGDCEVCDAPIFSGDYYATGEEGEAYCRSCAGGEVERTCGTCTAWSQLLAHGAPGEPGVRAACLNPESPRGALSHQQETWPTAADTCDHWTRDPKMGDAA